MASRKAKALDPNFKDFIALLNSNGVRYLLLGGYAVNYYGHHRFTADIDFWIAVDPTNARNISRVLIEWGFTPENVKPEQFLVPEMVHMFGVKPLQIDLLTGPSGVEFESCYRRRVTTVLDGVEVALISLEDLLQNKLASGRDKDLSDFKKLSKKPKSI